ncbi:hypothetical protein Tco_1011516 [Tanacetum coccineum]
MRAAAPSTHHSLLPSGTPPLLPIPFPSSSVPIPPLDRREIISEADMPPWKRLLLTAPTLRFEIEESSTVARQPWSFVAYRAGYSLVDTEDASIRAVEEKAMYDDAQDDRSTVRAEIEVLRRERLTYERERESSETRQDLARSEAHNRALEARIVTMETVTRAFFVL